MSKTIRIITYIITAPPLLLLAILIAGLFWLINTEGGARFAIETGMEYYNRHIPGSLAIGTIEGTLNDGVTMKKIVLRDRGDRTLVEMGVMTWHVSLADLATLDIVVDRLDIENVRIQSSVDGRAGEFGDLAPLTTTTDEPFFVDLPTLPVGVVVNELVIHRVAVVDGGRGGNTEATPRGKVKRITLDGTWTDSGVKATLEVFGGVVAVAPDDPLDGLEVKTARLEARVSDAQEGQVSLIATTTRGQLSIDGTLRLGHRLAVDGTLALRDGVVEDWYPQITGSGGADGHFSVRIDDNPLPRISMRVKCHECVLDATGPVALHVDAALTDHHLTATGSVTSQGVSGDVEVDIPSLLHGKVQWLLTVTPTKSLKTALQPFVPVTAWNVERLWSRGSCRVRTFPQVDITCDGDATATSLVWNGVSAKELAFTGNVRMDNPMGGIDTFETEGDLRATAVSLGTTHLRTVTTQFEVNRRQEALSGTVGVAVVASKQKRGTLKSDFLLDSTGGHLTVTQMDGVLGSGPITATPFALTLTDNRVRITRKVVLGNADGQLTVSGTVAKDAPSDLRIRLDKVALAPLAQLVGQDLSGALSASVRVTRRLENPTISVKGELRRGVIAGVPIEHARFSSRLRDGQLQGRIELTQQTGTHIEATAALPLAVNLATGQASVETKGPMQLTWDASQITPQTLGPWGSGLDETDFTFASSGTVIQQDGRQDAEVTVLGNVEISSMKQLGSIPVDLAMKTTGDDQHLRLDTALPGLPVSLVAHTGIDVAALLDGRLRGDVSSVRITAGDGEIFATGKVDSLQNAEATVKVTRIKLSDFASLVSLPIGDLLVNGEIRGAVAGGRLSADTTVNARLQLNSHLPLGTVDLTGSYRDERARISGTVRHGFGEAIHFDAAIPLLITPATRSVVWHRDEDHLLTVDIPPVTVKPLAAMLAPAFPFSGRMGLNGSVRGPIAGLQGQWVASGTLEDDILGRIPLDVSLDMKPMVQRLKLTAGLAGSRMLTGRLHMRDSLWRVITDTADLSTVPIDGHAELSRMNLRLLNGLSLPVVYDIDGVMEGEVTVAGTVGTPLLNGRLSLSKGAMSLAGLKDRVIRMNGEVVFASGEATVEKLTFSSGAGNAQVDARWRWGDNNKMDATIDLRARKFPVEMTGIPRVLLNTHLETHLNRTAKQMTVDGVLKNTRIHIPARMDSSAKKIPANPNVRIIYPDRSEDVPSMTWSVPLRGQLRTASPVHVEGRDLDTHWNIDVDVQARDDAFSVSGTAVARRGTFNLLGNQFVLDTGRLDLSQNGEIETLINVLARCELTEATVILEVTGNLMRPQLRLTSEPGFAEEQIITLLLTGSTQEGNEATSAVAAALTMRYPRVRNFLYNRLGIDRLKVGNSSTGATTITVGRRMTDRVTLSTMYNLDPVEGENELALTLETSVSRLSILDTTVGDKASSVGLFWKIPIAQKRPASFIDAKNDDDDKEDDDGTTVDDEDEDGDDTDASKTP